MSTNQVQDGDTITYANTGTAITSGSVVVVGSLVCVAAVDIAATTGVGTLFTEGVFTLPKIAAGSGRAFTVGELIWLDITTNAFDKVGQGTQATGDITGSCIAYKAALTTDTTAQVKINVGAGVVHA